MRLALVGVIALSCSCHWSNCFAQINDTPLLNVNNHPDAGYIQIVSNADSIAAIIDEAIDHPKWLTPEDNIITLPAGRHKVTLAAKGALDHRFNLEVIENDTITQVRKFKRMDYRLHHRYSVYPYLYWKDNLLVQTDPGAQIFVDGEYLGEEFATVSKDPGTYVLEVRHPDAGTNRRSVTVYPTGSRLYELYTKPAKKTFRRLLWIPGASQIYERQYIRGAAFSTSFVLATLLTGIYGFKSMRSAVHAKQAQAAYEQVRFVPRDEWHIDYESSANYWRRTASRSTSIRNMCLGLTAVIYVANVIDGLFPPRGGFREQIDVEKNASPYLSASPAGLGFSVSF